MKNRLLLVMLFCSFLAFSQQRTEVVLNWVDNTTTSIGDVAVKIPVFDAKNMSYLSSTKQLYYTASFSTGGSVNPASLQITNIVYENITREQLGQLSAALPSSVNASIKAVKSRDSWSAALILSPIIKEGSGYKRVKSFAYTYALGGGQNKTNAAASVSNSVLASGDWYRFYVQKSGVYKLTRAFLQQLGLDVNVDPRTIKIYGNGGRMLPMLNSVYYPTDLTENAVKFVGEADGNFGTGDYILFYAEGVDNWNTDSATNNNLFTDKSYYYVTTSGGNGKRIQESAQPNAAAAVSITAFDEYQYHELDLINIARLGRKWHGEAFNITNEQEFKFTVSDVVTTEPVSITVSAAATSTNTTSMVVTANNAAITTLSFDKLDEHILGKEDIKTGAFNTAGSAVTVKLAYNNGGNPSANAWLDYIILKAKRSLKGNSTQFRFRYNDAKNTVGIVQYNFTSATSISEVWDITDIYNATKIINQGGQVFSFKSPYQGEVREYITVVPSDYYTPLRESKARIANQNLKGTIFNNSQGQFQDVDYIIVTPASFNSSAEKLANMHRTQSGLNVKVVNLENIYEEFSAGKQDIGAIRNFVKYVYNNAGTTAGRIKYLNLFGDASFDYKNRIPNNTNIVPTVHCFVDQASTLNYSEVETYVTDDFFGLMDDNEGMMGYRPGYGLDIAVGRMLLSTKTQADQMVNKAITYKDADSYGRWRNEYLMIADDVDASSDTDFVTTLEKVANSITTYRPFVNIRKVYSDSYVQQSSAGGQRYPDAKEQIVRYINNGSVVVNYLGHGNETTMASERIFEASDAQGLTNTNKYALFITATCELTKFDNPYVPTVGEDIYNNPNGGGIAMISTTRAIYISAAFDFNEQLSGYLYAYTSAGVLGEYPTMAEALRLAKAGNAASQFVTCVSFIGDPALKLAIAKPQVVLTKINDKPISGTTDVLQSLAYVKLSGNVVDESGAVLNSYTGDLEASVFDKAIQRTTLNNDGKDQQRPFAVLGETIYRGNASVTNGQFEFGFVVPRDIRIPVGNGRVSFYSKKANVLEDRTGYNSTIQIGGVNTNAEADTTPPTVKLYMNDESFVSGGLTNASPILLAYLEDAHGINTASGIGHDIIGILDGDETNEYLMNDYYQTNTDDYKKGTLRFPFAGLAKGMHTLTFKAWDVYNNLVTAEIQFVVSGDDALTLEKVLNYPNPFVSYTEFWFNHNRPFEPLDVQVQIFTVTGKIVKTINQTVTTDGFLSRDIKWDGRDDFGDKIGKGVYIYKLTVKSSTTNKKAEKFEKLVLL